jgi:hypothetical protein
MAIADLAIRIATSLDASGINRTEKSIGKLQRSVKGLSKAIGAIAIGAFAKKSLSAFVADELAANRLTQAVKNLGLEFANPFITEYISNLERTAQVADDELRPAFQRLLQQTGSLAKSQSILNTAIEVSRGSGVALGSVAEDLAKAYYGNTRTLQKYSLGLSKAALQTKSFSELQDILNEKFAGSNQAYLQTYAGQVSILSLAFGNLQENAGKALFTLAGASGDQSSGARRLGFLVDAFGLGLIEMADTLKKAVAAFGQAYLGFSTAVQQQAPAAIPGQELFRKSMSNAAKLSEIEARQAKIYKDMMANQKKITAEQKKQAALKKAGTVFDQEQIQLLAALRGKLSEDDRKRVEAQLALLNENDVLANKLTREIFMAQDATGGLYRYFLTIGNTQIKNPFAFLDEWIIQFQEKLNNLKFPTLPLGTGVAAAVAPVSGAVLGFTPQDMGVIPTRGAVQGPQLPSTNVGTLPTGNFTYGQGNPLNTNVYVTVQGSVIAEQDLTETIARNLQNSSLSSGKVAQLERYSGFFL